MKIETKEVEAKDLRVGDVILDKVDCRLITKIGKTLIHGHKTCKIQNIFWLWGGATGTSTAEEIHNERNGRPFNIIRLADLVM